MTALAKPIVRLIAEFGKLPTVGPKTAQRLTYFLLRQPKDEVQPLAAAIMDLMEQIVTCNTCFNLGTRDPCHFCTSPNRDHNCICVVEEPLDVLALERTAVYRGQYHVLHGSFSPMDGVLEDDLRVRELVARVEREQTEEVIVATNATVEGEATANLVRSRLQTSGVQITRLAQGLPIGSDLEYADDYTLCRALEGRREY